MKRQQQAFSIERAETMALKALAFLAADAARLNRFLTLTGVNLATLREEAANSDTLAAVLDYMCRDESLLLVFTSTADIEPADVEPALAVLIGARRQH